MADTLTYWCSTDLVMVGDRVRISRKGWWRKPWEGVVCWVYDPSKEVTTRGDNDFGFEVQLDNERGYVRIDEPSVRNVKLLARARS